MKLHIKVLWWEVASVTLDLNHQADVVAEAVEAVERKGGKLLNKGIKKMSAVWVNRMMG